MAKIYTIKEIITLRNRFSSQKMIIFATGVFDILHAEHIRFLNRAKSQGDILIVGIEPDIRVKGLKGKGRPTNPQKKRAEAIAELTAVNYSFILPTNLGIRKGREKLIKNLRPDIYAISANTPFQKEKRRIIKKFGAKLAVVLPHNPKISTSEILKSQQNKQAQPVQPSKKNKKDVII